MIRRIDRYLLSEMLIPACVGIMLLLLMLIGNVLYAILNFVYGGAPLQDIGMILLYKLPVVLQQAIPGSLLLGTALALNRLERDRELLALRMAGIRLKRIVLPLIILGLLSAGVIFWLQEKVIPHTTHQAERTIRKLAWGTPTAIIQSDVFFRAGNAFIYVHEVDTRRQVLRQVMVYQRVGGTLMVHIFPWAENHNGQWIIKPDPVTKEPPQRFTFGKDADGHFTLLNFLEAYGDDGFFNMKEDVWQYLSDQPSKPDELTLQQLLKLRDEVRGYGSIVAGYILPLNARQLNFFLNRRLAITLGGLVAVLIAIPLAVHFGRSGGYVGLLLSGGVAFFFIVAQQWTQVLAVKNMLHPVIAAWAPDVVFGLIGLVLLIREE